MIFAEYIWIDGVKPTPRLRSKTKCIEMQRDVLPWTFDGSSTKQAEGGSSDCILKPIRIVRDPLRGRQDLLVLCEVYDALGTAAKTNHRTELSNLDNVAYNLECLFGMEQEYTFFKGRDPLGWPVGGYPAPQGPFYCGIGADEVFGRNIVEEHIEACRVAGLGVSGINAEVMPGQWEFQVGAHSALKACDDIWLARYLLYRIAANYGVNVKLHPKPVEGDWNGAGMHCNFSTKRMREDIEFCKKMCDAIGEDFKKNGFPEFYGHGYKERLTGEHETCSWKEFKWGVSDRTASVRIPYGVWRDKKGYIEDRRPCANADPYQVASYLINIALDAGV